MDNNSRAQLLGDFRRMVEPYWNESAANAGSGKLSYHDKFLVAMYVAHLMICTPAWRRVGVSNHNQLLAVAMIERGELAMDTDPDYVKALMTKMHYAWAIYNQDGILVRSDPTEAFITSVNPVALKYSGTAGEAVHPFLPITPQLLGRDTGSETARRRSNSGLSETGRRVRDRIRRLDAKPSHERASRKTKSANRVGHPHMGSLERLDGVVRSMVS
jgi:hypothetical protein